MDEFVIHANHNDAFHVAICQTFPDTYYDWKLTCLFYVAIHYLKALALKRKKSIGQTHYEINNNIRSGKHRPAMPIADTAFNNYMNLFHYSQSARYDGVEDINIFTALKKGDYEHALKCFGDFKKFIISNDVKLS